MPFSVKHPYWVDTTRGTHQPDYTISFYLSVTLGDKEARKRKVQKNILERKGPPTFTCAVEMISRTECRVHHRLDAIVDANRAILAGKTPLFEIRQMGDESNNATNSSIKPEKSHPKEHNFAETEKERSEVDSVEVDMDITSKNAKRWSSDKSGGKCLRISFVLMSLLVCTSIKCLRISFCNLSFFSFVLHFLNTTFFLVSNC